MAHRRALASFAIGILPPGCRSQAEEPGSIPSDAGDGSGDLGKAGKGFAAMGKPIGHDRHAVDPPVPGPHQLGARLDPPRQVQSTIGLHRGCLYHLVKQPPGGRGKATVGLLLNRVGNAAAEQVRTESLWRFVPEQLAVALPQLGYGRCRQPIPLCLKGWIGPHRSVYGFHDAAPALPIRYTRVPSTFSEVRFSFSFFLTTPAKKPRTECCCQSVAFMIASMVVPFGWRSRLSTISCLEEGANFSFDFPAV